MPYRLVLALAILLAFWLAPASAQQAETPSTGTPAPNPMQNPFYLYPWLANTAPSINSNIGAQGISADLKCA